VVSLMTRSTEAGPASSADVRADLVDALRLDLVGPRPGNAPHRECAEEVLRIAPSKWYLTGFLVPYEAPIEQRTDDDGDETLDVVDRVVEADDDNAPEPASARKAFFPSSMGLSVLISADTAQLHVALVHESGLSPIGFACRFLADH
jgi:hypothetical protein